MKRALIIFILLLFSRVQAQETPARMRSLSQADGLPQGFISGFVLDQQGVHGWAPANIKGYGFFE